MEKRFKSLSIFEFQVKFPDDLSCIKYLSDLKRGDGYRYIKCADTHYYKGNRAYDRQFTHCRYTESATAGKT